MTEEEGLHFRRFLDSCGVSPDEFLNMPKHEQEKLVDKFNIEMKAFKKHKALDGLEGCTEGIEGCGQLIQSCGCLIVLVPLLLLLLYFIFSLIWSLFT